MKTVFVNPERCIGCKQCQIACAIAHSESKNLFDAIFETPLPRPRILVSPGLYLDTSFPNKCRHCNPAPCMTVCPTAAISHDPEMDTIALESSRCIACGMCALVCPFDVLTFYPASALEPERQVALKCDHCVERRKKSLIPACVEACKTGALVFGEFNELVKKARTQMAIRASSDPGEIKPDQAGIPGHISAWRALGKSISKTGKEV